MASGTFVQMVGSVAQSIGGTTAMTLANLTINNSAGVTLNNYVNITGNVDVTLGSLTTNGKLTIKSTRSAIIKGCKK